MHTFSLSTLRDEARMRHWNPNLDEEGDGVCDVSMTSLFFGFTVSFAHAVSQWLAVFSVTVSLERSVSVVQCYVTSRFYWICDLLEPPLLGETREASMVGHGGRCGGTRHCYMRFSVLLTWATTSHAITFCADQVDELYVFEFLTCMTVDYRLECALLITLCWNL